MKVELTFSITELSSLTGKTRPTLYKYIKAYESECFDDVPFSFIKLFDLMNKPNVKRSEITEYCQNNFQAVDSDIKVNEIISLIKENKNVLNLDNLKRIIEEEIDK